MGPSNTSSLRIKLSLHALAACCVFMPDHGKWPECGETAVFAGYDTSLQNLWLSNIPPPSPPNQLSKEMHDITCCDRNDLTLTLPSIELPTKIKCFISTFLIYLSMLVHSHAI